MPTTNPMFCKRCYADLKQSGDVGALGCFFCVRCKRRFDPMDLRTYLSRPFPSRRKIIIHSIITLILATIVSIVVAGWLSVAQMKYFHSTH